MANINRFPNPASELISTISQLPLPLAQITTGVVHLVLLVARLALTLMSVPFLIPLLLVSILATVAENMNKFVVGTASKQTGREVISGTRPDPEERVEVQARRESKTSEPSGGSYRRDYSRGVPISSSR